MMLFYLFIFIKAEIPDQYKELVHRAIKQSESKVIKSNEFESANPGNYIFDQYKFTLKKACTSPFTKDIKGYAIDNTTENAIIAIVKPKTFKLHNFSFLVPNDNQIYDMSHIIASDNSVIIYNTTKLTIFDIITNFEYYSKKTKIEDSFLWNATEQKPITTEVSELNGSNIGCGGTGMFIVDFHLSFKSNFYKIFFK